MYVTQARACWLYEIANGTFTADVKSSLWIKRSQERKFIGNSIC